MTSSFWTFPGPGVGACLVYYLYDCGLIDSVGSVMDQKVIELDVGGRRFRTTKSTLCSTDGYFARMLQNENWAEGQTESTIFIDRDPTVFDGILSYLRSSQVIFSDSTDHVYLRRLLIEADYYQLIGLAEGIRTELAEREKLAAKQGGEKVVQKVVGATEVQQQLGLGWTYVANYEGNETNACAAHGSKVEALWRSNQCTACGEYLGYEKFLKHVTFFRPRQVVLQKTVASGIPNNDSLRDLDSAGLVFDSSFG